MGCGCPLYIPKGYYLYEFISLFKSFSLKSTFDRGLIALFEPLMTSFCGISPNVTSVLKFPEGEFWQSAEGTKPDTLC